jgi:nitrogen fixation/metabolism regulation signal transduction histidine kinase
VTLRARLVVALLALALIPTALFTAFTLDQLDRATRRWFQPGVEDALEAAREVSHPALARLDAMVLAGADEWATRWPAGPLTATRRDAMRAELRADALDLVQLYVRAGGRWRLEDQVVAEKLIVPLRPDFADLVGAALDSSRMLHTPRGALAAVARIGPAPAGSAPGSGERAVLVGLLVPADFFQRIDRIGEGLSHYRRLGVLVDVQRRFVWLLVGGVVLALLGASFFAATTIARDTARPLSALAGALEQVAQGDLDARVVPAGARELRVLGTAFNVMTGRLARARESLAQAEREAAWRRAASQIAHEIKNSLTPMRLSLARIERRMSAMPPGERDAMQHSLGVLLREIEDLARMADHFSEYARLPEPRLEPLDLAEVANTAAALHDAAVVRAGIAAGCTLPVRGDRLLLSRALHNLIVNAREASPPGATVEVRAAAEAGRAVVEVLDRGAGVPESVRGRAFEPYVSTKARGSGLGLALVRDIATQHGGTVTLEQREGGGACARLSLPLRDSEEAAGGGGTPVE